MTSGSHDELRQIAGPVSRETYDKLLQFEAEFRRWSARINLAAPSTLADLWRRHILDSAQLFRLEPDAVEWLDLGSGGGFPGAVMAILLSERAGGRISLVESNRKKSAFLQTILGRLQAPATVYPVRIEDAPGQVPRPQIVTARALAPLPDLIGLAAPWLRAGARGLFHKGRDYRAELANCADAWRFDLVEHRSVIDDASVILDISNVEPR
jgi:16S rRNA (guanine527-N7)-methyltransferase